MTDKPKEPKPNRITMKSKPKTPKPKPQWTDAEREELREAVEKVQAFLNSEEYTIMKRTFPGGLLKGTIEELSPAEVRELAYFIDEINQAAQQAIDNPEQYATDHQLGEQSFIDGLMGKVYFSETDNQSILNGLFQAAKARARIVQQELFDTTAETLRNPPNQGTSIIINDFITNTLKGKLIDGTIQGIINQGEQTAIYARPHNKPAITASVLVTIGDNVTLSGKGFTEYHHAVLNELAGLWRRGIRAFTPEMLYREMNGKSASDTVSEKAYNEILSALEDMQQIHADLDFTAVAKAKNLNIQQFGMKGYLLSLKSIYGKVAGKPKQLFQILDEPILLTNAEVLGQLISYDTRLKAIKRIDKRGNTCEIVKTSPIRDTIRHYLLTAVSNIKAHKRNATIKLDTLYTWCNVDTNDRRAMKQARDYIFQCLDYWKSKEMADISGISDYTITMQGRKIDSVTIILYRDLPLADKEKPPKG